MSCYRSRRCASISLGTVYGGCLTWPLSRVGTIQSMFYSSNVFVRKALSLIYIRIFPACPKYCPKTQNLEFWTQNVDFLISDWLFLPILTRIQFLTKITKIIKISKPTCANSLNHPPGRIAYLPTPGTTNWYTSSSWITRIISGLLVPGQWYSYRRNY